MSRGKAHTRAGVGVAVVGRRGADEVVRLSSMSWHRGGRFPWPSGRTGGSRSVHPIVNAPLGRSNGVVPGAFAKKLTAKKAVDRGRFLTMWGPANQATASQHILYRTLRPHACVRRCRPCLPAGTPGARHGACHQRRRLRTGRCRPTMKKRRQEVKENRRCDRSNKRLKLVVLRCRPNCHS